MKKINPSREFFFACIPLALIFFCAFVVERKEIYGAVEESYTPFVYGFPFAFFGDTAYRLNTVHLAEMIADFLCYLVLTTVLWTGFRFLYRKDLHTFIPVFLSGIGVVLLGYVFLFIYCAHPTWQTMDAQVVSGYWKLPVFSGAH